MTLLDGLAPIGLDELVATAGLLTRTDRKYLLDEADADRLVSTAPARVLDIDGRRSFRYESTYFDTPTWDSYLGAARRRPNRFKVRTRAYLDTGASMLEVKVRDRRGRTVKHREPHPIEARGRLLPSSRRFLDATGAAAGHLDRLRPVLHVAYLRTTLALLEVPCRVTVDRGVTWRIDERPAVVLHGLVLLETKSAGPTTDLDRALWRSGHRPVAVSKYCTGLAALLPQLPSNKWHRLVRTRIAPNLHETGDHR